MQHLSKQEKKHCYIVHLQYIPAQWGYMYSTLLQNASN